MLLAAAVAASTAPIDFGPAARNALLAANILLLIIFGRGASGADLPFPRGNGSGALLVGAAALLTSVRTLTLPYMADDYCLLNDRGRTSGLAQTMFDPTANAMWFRPVYWLFWKLYHEYSPSSGRLAHAASITMFTIHCCMIAPALRRAGVRRGIAHGAALLFALSPAALDTVAWVTNQCSLLAGIFSCLCIISIPRGVRSAGRTALACFFAICAFYSKEESFVLPFVALLAASRFQLSFIKGAFARTWPIFAVAGLAFIIRMWMLAGAGSYKSDATGNLLIFERILSGPLAALKSELPSHYWIPARYWRAPDWRAVVIYIIPFLLFVYAGRGAARDLLKGSLLCIAGIAPISSMLPIGEWLESSRWLYAPTIGISLAAASLLANGFLRGRAGWILIITYGAATAAVAHYNYDAWRRSGDLTAVGKKLMNRQIKDSPEGARFWFLGLPEEVDGAQCFNCGLQPMARRISNRYDIETSDSAHSEGDFYRVAEADLTKQTIKNVFGGDSAATIAPGEEFEFNSTKTHDITNTLYLSNVRMIPSDRGAVWFVGLREGGVVFFPPVSLARATSLQIKFDATKAVALDGAQTPAEVFALVECGSRVEQRRIGNGETIQFPSGASKVIINLRVAPGIYCNVKSIKIRSAGT